MTQWRAIAAVSDNGAIGVNNTLPWHLPNDLKHFKQLTMGSALLLGRNTFESFPNQKPLPNRVHVVLSHKDWEPKNDQIIVARSLEHAKTILSEFDSVFVVGGGQVYQSCLPWCDTLYYTQVHCVIEQADVFFPKVSQDWQLISEEKHHKDDKHVFDYTFKIFRKIKNHVD